MNRNPCVSVTFISDLIDLKKNPKQILNPKIVQKLQRNTQKLKISLKKHIIFMKSLLFQKVKIQKDLRLQKKKMLFS